MKTFLVKQKFRLGGERFDIKDDRGVVNYQVEGSFFQIPKTFTESTLLMFCHALLSFQFRVNLWANTTGAIGVSPEIYAELEG